jgi:pimeloyl-ACP methyl ester carboxylesterase
MKFASALGAAVLLLALAGSSHAVPPVSSTQKIDLGKLQGKGFPPSMKVTVYRAPGAGTRQPLVLIVPQYGSVIEDGWFASQAEYFTDAAYVVAVPHLTDLYQDDRQMPAYDGRMRRDLVEDTTPYAVELLATLIALTGPDGPATPQHVVLGVGYGAIVAANYAALGPPGCEGLVMISAGFGARKELQREEDDMRDSVDAFGRLGQRVKLPSLWLNAASNRRISDQTAQQLFAAFHAGSPAATLRVLPDLGVDGDWLFSVATAPAAWQPETGKFLAAVRKQ